MSLERMLHRSVIAAHTMRERFPHEPARPVNDDTPLTLFQCECGRVIDYEPIQPSVDPESGACCYECLPENMKAAYDAVTKKLRGDGTEVAASMIVHDVPDWQNTQGEYRAARIIREQTGDAERLLRRALRMLAIYSPGKPDPGEVDSLAGPLWGRVAWLFDIGGGLIVTLPFEAEITLAELMTTRLARRAAA